LDGSADGSEVEEASQTADASAEASLGTDASAVEDGAVDAASAADAESDATGVAPTDGSVDGTSEDAPQEATGATADGATVDGSEDGEFDGTPVDGSVDATLETEAGENPGDAGAIRDVFEPDVFTGVPTCPSPNTTCTMGDAAAPLGQVCGPNGQCLRGGCSTAIRFDSTTTTFPVGTMYSGTVATITDPFATSPPLSATIDWGDGNTSSGGVAAGSNNTWTVSGTHEYASRASVIVTVTVTDPASGVSSSDAFLATVGASFVTEVALPINDGSVPSGSAAIAAGSDGNLWFTTSSAVVGRVDTTGTSFAQFSFPNGEAPVGITAGADGNLWFTLPGSAPTPTNAIGKMTTAGVPSVFTIPSMNAYPEQGIIAGPGGNVWFTEEDTDKIGSIASDGSITDYQVYGAGGPNYITPGPDGNLWVAFGESNAIVRMTPQGAATVFHIPSSTCNAGYEVGIAAGSDGALWFTQPTQDATGAFIGRITTSGSISILPYPLTVGTPDAMVAGPDGALWFVDGAASLVGRVTTTGSFLLFATPTASANPQGITVGPDGNIWFTEAQGGKLGYVTPTPP
jgi:streptogramin lyase